MYVCMYKMVVFKEDDHELKTLAYNKHSKLFKGKTVKDKK